jgi:CrcB protein
MTREHEIRDEIARLPVDSDVEVSPRPLPHPWSLVRRDADLLPVIAVGGALGSLARWAVARGLPHGAAAYAWSTFVVNISGALVLGVLMALVLDVWSERRYLRPFLGVGVLGGYTTFSTYLLDERGLVTGGRPGVALAYLLATLVAGFTATAVGLATTREVLDRRRAGRDVEAPSEEARR